MRRKILTGVTAMLIAFMPLVAATGDAVTLKGIMQGLRDNLVSISDGLLTDDFELVATGATAIASHPQIPAKQVQLVAAELGSEMPVFKQIDTLVHDLALEIKAAAISLDHDAAASAYQRMIEGCFACHRTFKERVTTALSPAADPQ